MVAKMSDEWLPYSAHISIHEADMRDFNPDVKADILISELLGSFACNELSPECLDGAQRLLKPGGISIPSSYTNYLQPVMARSLWEDVATFAPKKDVLLNDFMLCEMRSCVMVAEYQEAFEFHHPNYGKVGQCLFFVQLHRAVQIKFSETESDSFIKTYFTTESENLICARKSVISMCFVFRDSISLRLLTESGFLRIFCGTRFSTNVENRFKTLDKFQFSVRGKPDSTFG